MKKETENRIRRRGTVLFVIYVLLLFYFLFFAEGYGRTAANDRVYRYNLVPFMEIQRFWKYRKQLGIVSFFANIAGNVIGFIPFGFMLPIICRKLNSGFLIMISGFSTSLCVETIQLVTRVGCFDVDDLILNTAGAVIGYFLLWLCTYLRRSNDGKKV